MNEYKTILGKDGRIAIPAAIRKQLHFEPGEKLIIRIKDHQLSLVSLKDSIKKAQNLVQKYSKKESLVKKLYALRQEDKARE